jgi:hypothetical protein
MWRRNRRPGVSLPNRDTPEYCLFVESMTSEEEWLRFRFQFHLIAVPEPKIWGSSNNGVAIRAVIIFPQKVRAKDA